MTNKPKKKLKKASKEIVKSKTDVDKKSSPTSIEVEVKMSGDKKEVRLKNTDNRNELIKKSTGFEDVWGGVLVIGDYLYATIDETQTAEQLETRTNHILAALADLKPEDGFEGMLIAQMVTIYTQAMACFKRSILNTKYPDALIKYQNQGIKLMRVYNQQLESLDKHRRKGKQKMTVEHVNVHEGGQAIVGTVTQGGSDNEK